MAKYVVNNMEINGKGWYNNMDLDKRYVVIKNERGNVYG